MLLPPVGPAGCRRHRSRCRAPGRGGCQEQCRCAIRSDFFSELGCTSHTRRLSSPGVDPVDDGGARSRQPHRQLHSVAGSGRAWLPRSQRCVAAVPDLCQRQGPAAGAIAPLLILAAVGRAARDRSAGPSAHKRPFSRSTPTHHIRDAARMEWRALAPVRHQRRGKFATCACSKSPNGPIEGHNCRTIAGTQVSGELPQPTISSKLARCIAQALAVPNAVLECADKKPSRERSARSPACFPMPNMI